jgi:pimeloyl-ACP methyl ester carboxylesterase
VFAFDYRGYGQSDGHPTEAGCIADGAAAQRWLAQRLGIERRDVILMGRSLGSAVAVALAADNGARALVLENAFTAMPDVASIHYPWLPVHWVMKNRYDSVARIRRYTGPLLQTHGAADVLIPIALARALFDAAPSKNKKWVEFPGIGHNDSEPARFYAELAAFVDAVTPPIGRGANPDS